ncbi:DUF2254 domain-containing protein [Propioniciclava soli]|uniref:DUF2254 domain-containing protein n=1 Tax=Propioniciclava soli TaxID=2775081 RepID=A0ABZ3CAY9_9ACTN|nr:DUF2254 domain-containing protein [Propioniciclava soli]
MPDSSRARGNAPQVKQWNAWQRLWRPFWAVPAAFSVAAVVVGVVLPNAENQLRQFAFFMFPGDDEAARGMLTTIASAMISVTGLVFSITMVVLQLASSQFTPRVLGTFLDSRVVQVTFGFFIATFLYALTVLRSVMGDDGRGDEAFVPRVAVSFGFLLVLACLVCFLAFIRHITSTIQVSKVISRIGDATMDLVDRVYPGAETGGSVDAGPSWSPTAGMTRIDIEVGDRHGHVDEIDFPGLVSIATDAGGVLVLHPQLGDFTTHGHPLATLWDADDELADDETREDREKKQAELSKRVNSEVRLATERSMRQDLSFGFRQLVDIGERALSPGVNDPTTATQVIDELHHLLREIVQRNPPSPYIAEEGVVRLVVHPPTGDLLLRLSLEELIHYGAGGLQVPRKLRLVLNDLAAVALPRYRSTIAELKDDLTAKVEAQRGVDSPQ